MADIIKKNMTEIWASAGDVQAPEDSKIRAGWVVESVPRQWWNWFENRQDNNIAYMLQKGIPEWDAETEYQTNKSYVQRNNVVYKATAVSINKDPALSANASSWVKAFVDSTPYLERIKGLTVIPQTLSIINSLGNADSVYYGNTGLSLISAATPTDARNIIGAQVGHPNLTALSGVTAATNVLPYFNSNSTMAGTPITTFSRDFLTRGDPTSGRAALGLGTASIYNAQPVAWSTGTLMFSGAFGLGGYSIISGVNNVNVNDPNCPSGFYDVSPDSIPGFVAPIAGTWTRIIHQCHGNAAGFATQIATANFAQTGGGTQMFVRKAAGSGWSAWSRIMTDEIYPVQSFQNDGIGGAAGGKLLRVGAFGIGANFDLRPTGIDTGSPSDMAGSGNTSGLTTSTIIGLSAAGLGVPTDRYVQLHTYAHGGVGTLTSFFRIATYTERMFIQGANTPSAWGPWREIYSTANTGDLTNTVTANVTANIQPTLNSKLFTSVYGITLGDQFQDPNTTSEYIILSQHPNCPDPATYWHITTTFYATKSSTANRAQLAVEYNPSGATRSFIRSSYEGVWKGWVRIDNNGDALRAGRLTNPRTIGLYGGASGSISFDGSTDANIGVTIVADSHNHSFSTISGLQAALDARTPSANQPRFSAAQSSLEAQVPAGQAIFTVNPTQSANGFAAAATFVREAYYGVNLGLSSIDNHLRIGGYSMGAVSYPILHTGNAAALGFGGTSGALGASGWTRLGNGLIIQWGAFSGNGNIPFPTAFPSVCTAVAQMQSGPLSGNVQRIALNGNPGNTSFNVTGVDPSFNLPARWIALGY